MGRPRNPDLHFVSNVFKFDPETRATLERFAASRHMSLADVIRLVILRGISENFDPQIDEAKDKDSIQFRLSKDLDELLANQVSRFKTNKQEYVTRLVKHFIKGERP